MNDTKLLGLRLDDLNTTMTRIWVKTRVRLEEQVGQGIDIVVNHEETLV